MTQDDLPASLRIDKWLWQARFFKTRSLAAKLVSGGKLRINGTRISKPARTVSAGDTLTFAQGDTIRVIRIVALGARRGPATEAQTLFTDLEPPKPRRASDSTQVVRKGRPDKRDRRTLLQNRWLDLE